MGTDLDRFIELYKSFGISLVPIPENDEDGIVVRLEEGSDPKFDGYSGFYSTATFSKEGKFIKQGFWE